MSDKDFVFRLGPLPAETEAGYIYYVYPGQPENYAFLARDDAAAWLRITKDYDPATLACEPLLDTPEKPEGVTVELYERYTAHALAIMTYANLQGDPLSAVQSEGMISDFVAAASAYLQSSYAASATGRGTLRARFEGSPNIRTSADLPDPKDRRTRLRFLFSDLKDDTSGERISFGADFRNDPGFAVNAMRRGFGLDTLAMPVVEAASGPGKPNDMILLLLISALTALSQLKPGTAGAQGTYRIGDKKVTCVIG